MTDSDELGSSNKVWRMLVEQLAHMCNKLNFAKVNSSQHGKVFYGWTVRINDIDHIGPMERTFEVFDGYLRFSKSNHDAELVLTDADGIPVLVLSCKHLAKVDLMGKRRHQSYRIVTEGATIVLATAA